MKNNKDHLPGGEIPALDINIEADLAARISWKLRQAIENNDINLVNSILELVPLLVNATFEDGQSPYGLAFRLFQDEIRIKLFRLGGRINAFDLEFFESASHTIPKLLHFCFQADITAFYQFQDILGRFSIVLEAAGASRFLNNNHTEHSIVIRYLQRIFRTEQSSEQRETALRTFLKKRWAYIHRTDLCYSSMLRSPSNILCTRIAMRIKKPHETIAQILMPTLTQDEYLLGETLEELTTDPITHEFTPCRFIVNERGNAIIPIIEWFEANIQNKDILMEQYYPPNPIRLSASEEEILENIALPFSKDFLSEFSLRKKLMAADKNSLAYEVLQLCDSLMKNGAASKIGSQATAAVGADLAIMAFSQKWYSLDEVIRKKISELDDFAQYLKNILEAKPNSAQASAADLCVEENAKGMKKVLRMHTDVFKGITFGSTSHSDASSLSAPQSRSFEFLLQGIRDRIKEREAAVNRLRQNAQDKDAEQMALILNYRAQDNGKERLDLLKTLYVQDLIREAPLDSLPIDNHFAIEYYFNTLSTQEIDALFLKLTQEQLFNFIGMATQKHSIFIIDYLLNMAIPDVHLHRTLLLNALKNGCIYAVSALINKKINVNNFSFSNRSALYHAFRNGNERVIEILVKAGALPIDKDFSTEIGKKWMAPHLAVKHGNKKLLEKIIQFCIKHGISLDARCQTSGKTALVMAVEHHHADMFEMLVEAGARLYDTQPNGNVILRADLIDSIMRSNNTQIMDYYLSKNGIFPYQKMEHPFNDQFLIHYLIEKNNIHALNACQYLHSNPQLILKKRPSDNLNCLGVAALYKRHDILKHFFSVSPNLLQEFILNTTLNGVCLLGYSVLNNDSETLQLLLEKNITLRDDSAKYSDAQGNTLLHSIVNQKLARIILMNDCRSFDLNAQNNEGVTALHIAAAQNDFQIFTLLLGNGAQFDIQNKQGQTAEDLTTSPVIKATLKSLREEKLKLSQRSEAGTSSPQLFRGHIDKKRRVTPENDEEVRPRIDM